MNAITCQVCVDTPLYCVSWKPRACVISLKEYPNDRRRERVCYAYAVVVAFKKCTLASLRQQKNNAAHNEFVVERLLYLQCYLPCINLHVPQIFHSNQHSDSVKKQLVKDYENIISVVVPRINVNYQRIYY